MEKLVWLLCLHSTHSTRGAMAVSWLISNMKSITHRVAKKESKYVSSHNQQKSASACSQLGLQLNAEQHLPMQDTDLPLSPRTKKGSMNTA